MKLPWPIYLALRQLSPSGRRTGSVFFYLAVLGVGLGVCVLVVVQSVMGGFGEVHRERIIDTSGHIDLSESGFPFDGAFALAEVLLSMPEVAEVTPYARGFVMARSGNVPVFPTVFGLAFDDEPVLRISPFLVAGELPDLFEDSVLISQQIANSLRVWVGSEIEVFSPTMLEVFDADNVPLPRTLTVVGVYHIDWNQDFVPGMVVTLRTLQDLYQLNDAVHGIAIRLHPGVDEFAFAGQLRRHLPDYMQVMTWRERWADFLWVLDLEKTLMLFLNLFIVAVAVFAIAIAQLLTVVRKTREIGLLAVLGGRQKDILTLYCFQGFFIGLVGVVVGVTLALIGLSMRNPLIDLLAGISGTRDTLTRFYYFANLPVSYNPWEIAFISCVAVGLSTTASLLPAWRAASLRPAETLRVEQ